jgi:hypothetical protein
MDTVLVGGATVLLFAGGVFLLQDRLNKSSLSPTAKRLGNYAMVALILGAAVVAINWHSTVWLASR